MAQWDATEWYRHVPRAGIRPRHLAAHLARIAAPHRCPALLTRRRAAPVLAAAQVFRQHTMLHQGTPVRGARKYLLRSDAMFERVEAPDLSADQQEARRQMRLDEAAELEGRSEEAAFHLEPELDG